MDSGDRDRFGSFQPEHQPLVAKEIKVGVIFAFGIGLLVWAQQPSWALVVATGLASVLFACNCVLVGHWEAEADRQQLFSSLSCCSPRSAQSVTPVLAFLFILTLLIGVAEILPRPVTASIAFSALTLALASSWLLAKSEQVVDDSNSFGPIRGLTADALLMTPIVLWWLV